MNFNEYQVLALRTASKQSNENMIINGALGLNGEAGEVADIIKKHLFQGHELDKDKIAYEIGDVLWYCAVLAKGIGHSLDTIADMNIDKLKKRYPNGFLAEASINRKD